MPRTAGFISVVVSGGCLATVGGLIVKWLCCIVIAGIVLLGAFAPAGAEEFDARTQEQIGALDTLADTVKSGGADATTDARLERGEKINKAFVALTGEAINPLFGVTALGIYTYYRTDSAFRDQLPIYDRPIVWLPFLAIILLMLFNSTAGEAFPFLKAPLNALGDFVNKVGALVLLPLAVKMFADALAEPIGREAANLAGNFSAVAYAGEAVASGGFWLGAGWLAALVLGMVVYLAVWLTFNVVDVLILLCPFPGVDALLKSCRLAMIGILSGSYHVSPYLALVLSLLVVAASFFIAGWSFRLSVFGLIYSTDILFFRKKDVDKTGILAFSASALRRTGKIPVRTLGSLRIDAEGRLVFAYRPWLILRKRRFALGKADDFSCGKGLLNASLVDARDAGTAWLSFPPRYRGREADIAKSFALHAVVVRSAGGSLRQWLASYQGTPFPHA